MASTQASDIGFVYVKNDNQLDNQQCRSIPAEVHQRPESNFNGTIEVHSAPITHQSPNPLSPTFREELKLQKYERFTEKEQIKDLKVKIRVRMAKFVLRGVSFGCSLIVLAMVSTSFSIFNSTKSLPPRNHLPAWAAGTKTWPQTFVLVMACFSLCFCVGMFWSYCRSGHRKAEKIAVYYTLFALSLFIFSSVMWGIAAGVLQGSRSNGQSKDIWGWSCIDNKRRELFADKVDYALVCRMQNWALVCCIIEIVLESITILLYAVVFYRFYSKQRLRKSMIVRDRARSDLYSAQIRSQSALIISGRGSQSPEIRPKFSSLAVNEENPKIVTRGAPTSAISTKPFCLQPPPRKTTSTMPETLPGSRHEKQSASHINAAPEEPKYESVPIPGAYRTPSGPESFS